MIEFNVVIATYNSAATLERCLESVRAISPAVSRRLRPHGGRAIPAAPGWRGRQEAPGHLRRVEQGPGALHSPVGNVFG